jgi:hypothetical protein
MRQKGLRIVFLYGSYHELSRVKCATHSQIPAQEQKCSKRYVWINWQWQVALQGIVNDILSTSSRNTGLSTSSTRTPQRYGLKTVRHHTVDTEYRVTDSKLRILRQYFPKNFYCMYGISTRLL